MKKYILSLMAISTLFFTACNRNNGTDDGGELDLPEEYYSGGKMGTVFNRSYNAFEQPSPAVTDYMAFKRGETTFEQSFVTGNGIAGGLGPVYIRTSCEACHPGYGRSRRVEKFDSNEMGNGYLVMIHEPNGDLLSQFTAMAQTRAVHPYLPPIDESGMHINWIEYTDEYGNVFPDGERYSLIYPEVTIDREALLFDDIPGNYQVSIEGTIGIFGTGLLDAIPDDSIWAQHDIEKTRGYCPGNPNPPIALDENKNKRIGRYTYGCTRSTLQNGPGSNALWNITNVTRPDRMDNYLTEAWVEKMAELGLDTVGLRRDKEPEMTMEEFDDFMVWHRGLAVPAARDLDDPAVKRGKEIFYSIGCTACHRPSWITGVDKHMPGYSHQKIWPYTDLLQHDLGMKNPGLRKWCRTTPLWARGLMYKCTGANDMLHDLRARTFEEAVLWHGGEAQKAKEEFRSLSKDDRNALVKFLEAI